MNLGFWNFYNAYNANRMFEIAESELGDNIAAPTVFMAQRLRELGHQVNTLDKVELSKLDAAVFFDHPTIFNHYYRECKRLGMPLYLFLNENPMHRPDNYWERLHRPFTKVFTWKPVRSLEPDDCAQWRGHKHERRPQYVEFRLPVALPETVQRTLLPPHEFMIERTKPRRPICAIWSQKYASYDTELYSERVKAIRWFEQHHKEDFDLFGYDWDHRYFTGIASRLNPVVNRLSAQFPGLATCSNRWPSWIGQVDSKHDFLTGYKFTLAYENASFPGYVTEKIFDAMFAGCIPVYLGAPDITDYIPSETFIDKRKFATYGELYSYLKHMSRTEFDGYCDAIEAFIRGPHFAPFTQETFTNLILNHILNI